MGWCTLEGGAHWGWCTVGVVHTLWVVHTGGGAHWEWCTLGVVGAEGGRGESQGRGRSRGVKVGRVGLRDVETP